MPIHERSNMYQRILLAYDGSDSGQRALLDSQELAQWSGVELTLVAVAHLQMDASMELAGLQGGIYASNTMESDRQHMQAILDDGLQRLRAAGRAASGVVLLGDTVDEITQHARTVSSDLIVVGHKRRSSWTQRWWRGSVSKALIEHSPCSVLVVVTD